MEPIRSGTTWGRIARAALLAALAGGFAIAFLYDGYVGYARENARDFARTLGLPSPPLPEVQPKLTSAEAARMIERAKAGGPLPELFAAFGQAAARKDGQDFYLGPGGWLRARHDEGRIAQLEWVPGANTEADQRWQRWIGMVLAALAIVFILRLTFVAAGRVFLTDAGLKMPGRRYIPFEAMTELRERPDDPAGCVALHYQKNGRACVLSLDPYVVRELPAVVAAIRQRKGYPIPTPAPSPDHAAR